MSGYLVVQPERHDQPQPTVSSRTSRYAAADDHDYEPSHLGDTEEEKACYACDLQPEDHAPENREQWDQEQARKRARLATFHAAMRRIQRRARTLGLGRLEVVDLARQEGMEASIEGIRESWKFARERDEGRSRKGWDSDRRVAWLYQRTLRAVARLQEGVA